MEKSETITKNQKQVFTDYVISRIKNDNAFRAALQRADNPDTESQAWEYLARWCNLDQKYERLPHALIAAAIARAKPFSEGYLGVGKAIAECYQDDGGNQSDSAKAKLRRLLACSSSIEACTVLRSLLRLMASRNVKVNYGKLLMDLVYFGDGERAKISWATDFYGRPGNDSVHP